MCTCATNVIDNKAFVISTERSDGEILPAWRHRISQLLRSFEMTASSISRMPARSTCRLGASPVQWRSASYR